MLSFKVLLTSLALACVASAKTIKITASSDNKFVPDLVKAAKGDVLEFHFEAKNHSVIGSDYNLACAPLPVGSGFYSGFMPVKSGEGTKVFQVKVNNTKPMAFYSSQKTECSDGMFGLLNPSKGETLAQYKTRASVLTQGITPVGKPYGGKLADAPKNTTTEAQDGSSSKSLAGTFSISIASLLGGLLLACLMV